MAASPVLLSDVREGFEDADEKDVRLKKKITKITIKR